MSRISNGNGFEQSRSFRVEHGPGAAYYSRFPDSRPHPVFRCLCGAVAEDGQIFNSWEGAGKWLDAHISEQLRLEDLKYHASLKAAEPGKAAATGAGR